MKPRDPIVDEVREIRDEYAKKFDYDLGAICLDLKRQEEESGREVVRLEPRPVEPRTKNRAE